jgi:hypothetical protein
MNEYSESELQTLLAEDIRTTEQGIRVTRIEQGFVLVGEVESPQRRDAIIALVTERFPEAHVHCDIGVTRMREPDEVEEL